MNKVQSQAADVNGVIAVPVDQLSDFSGTPNTNDLCVFGSGTDWTPAVFSNTIDAGTNGYSYFGVYNSGSVGIANNTRFDVGNRFIYRRGSGSSYLDSSITPNTTVASTAGVGGTSSQWYMSFDVGAGNWLIYTTTPIRPYSSSTMTLQWTDGSNYYGPKLEMNQAFKCPDVHISYVSLSSTTEIWLRVMASNNSYLHTANQHTAVSFNFLKVN